MTLPDQENSVAHCFSCLDLMNTIVLLTMPLSLHDADDAITNHVKWLKIHVTYHFDHLELTNAMLLFMIQSVSCNVNTGIT